MDSAVSCYCVQQAWSQGQPGCGWISFHLCTICQQYCSSRGLWLQQNRWRGWSGSGRRWQPLWLCLQETVASQEAEESCRRLLNPMGGPLELHLLPDFLRLMKRAPGRITECVSTHLPTSLSLSLDPQPPTFLATCAPRSLFYRKLSARPLLLCL